MEVRGNVSTTQILQICIVLLHLLQIFLSIYTDRTLPIPLSSSPEVPTTLTGLCRCTKCIFIILLLISVNISFFKCM